MASHCVLGRRHSVRGHGHVGGEGHGCFACVKPFSTRSPPGSSHIPSYSAQLSPAAPKAPSCCYSQQQGRQLLATKPPLPQVALFSRRRRSWRCHHLLPAAEDEDIDTPAPPGPALPVPEHPAGDASHFLVLLSAETLVLLLLFLSLTQLCLSCRFLFAAQSSPPPRNGKLHFSANPSAAKSVTRPFVLTPTTAGINQVPSGAGLCRRITASFCTCSFSRANFVPQQPNAKLPPMSLGACLFSRGVQRARSQIGNPPSLRHLVNIIS